MSIEVLTIGIVGVTQEVIDKLSGSSRNCKSYIFV